MWQWSTSELQLAVDPQTLRGQVARSGGAHSWRFDGTSLEVVRAERFAAGIRADVRDQDGVALQLSVELDADAVVMSVDGPADWQPEGPPSWPTPLLAENERPTELALPIHTTQGIVHHPDPAKPLALTLAVDAGSRTRLSMPFWSVSTRSEGVLSILDTPADAGLAINSGGAEGIEVSVRWLPILGRFGQRRTVRHVLVDPGYVAAALRYRRHVQQLGRFVSLAEKIDERPAVGGLIGAPYFSTGYLPFSERKLREVLDGLVALGYRNGLLGPIDLLQWQAEPWLNDYQPFISEPGFAKLISDAGYLPFAWFYLEDVLESDPTFEESELAKDENGQIGTGWQNRDYRYRRLCDSQLATRGRRLMKDRAAQYAALHFDTTTSKELLECWSPEHPMTRAEDQQFRHDWLAEVASWGHVIGSESGYDWAFDVMDFCSNNPRRGLETGGFPGAAVHVPLQGLIYHDSVISYSWEYDPYNPSYWGGDWSQSKLAYDLMCGNPPTVSPVMGYFPVIGPDPGPVSSKWVTWEDPTTQKLLRQALAAAGLHALTAHQAMISHAYLDEAMKVSRTVYASGTEVVVNTGDTPYVDSERHVDPGAWALDGKIRPIEP